MNKIAIVPRSSKPGLVALATACLLIATIRQAAAAHWPVPEGPSSAAAFMATTDDQLTSPSLTSGTLTLP